MGADNFLPTVVNSVTQVAADVVSIELIDREGNELPAWLPGAHIDVLLPSGQVRSYSLHGDPRDQFSYRVAVLRVAGGRGGSIEAHRVAVAGADLPISRPRNNFALRPARHQLFLAGGIGVTPLLAMAREVAGRGDDWTFVYGGRRRTSMAFVEELQALPGAAVQVIAEDELGFADFATAFRSLPDSSIAYCCGPAPMIEAVQAIAAATRPDVDVVVERFAAAEPIDANGDTAFEVRLARSDTTVTVPAGTSILEAVMAVRTGVTSSCRAGICSACETKVLGGVPDHRDSVLTTAERDSNRYIMICVSRSKTAKLVLDL